MNTRPFIIIGNWKMNKTIDEAKAFIQGFLASFTPRAKEVVGLAVPFTLLYPAAEEVGGRQLLIGAQNMNDASEGAFTGEVAARMVKDAGGKFVLLGHSERRRFYGEDDIFINRKVLRALEAGVQPVLCIGETQEQHAAEQTHTLLEAQLTEGLRGVAADQAHHLIIAYEPVWAIGQGVSADSEAVQKVHSFCRELLGRLFTEEAAEKIAILYGGSVGIGNAADLLLQPDIDGLLIGGASLSLETFLKIVNDSYTKYETE